MVVALAAACGSPPPPAGEPEARPPAGALPPIPAVDGPLDLRVAYPRESGYVATRGDNFIFGSAGNGRARVRINGRDVDVQANGAFLAFVPVPEDGVYRVRATLDDDTARLEVAVSIPPPVAAPTDAPRIRAGSISPTGAWAAQPGERIDVEFQGTPGGQAWLALPGGTHIPLPERPDGRGGATEFEVTPGDTAAAGRDDRWATYRGFLAARRILARDASVEWPRLASEPGPLLAERNAEGAGAELVLVVRGDTLVRPLPLNLVVVDPDRPRVGIGWDAAAPEENGDRHIIARPGPGGGPYHYTWRNGVELELTGERNGILRARLEDDLTAWTPVSSVRLEPPGTPPPSSRVSTVRLDPRPDHIDVYVALDRRLPYAIEQDDRGLSVLVYGATSRVNFLQHGRLDPYIVRGEWRQPSDRLFRLDLRLADRPWGYETFWGPGDDLVLRIRRPPALDPDRPLAGLTVGVDAGHGGGDRRTRGPTGLTEADANLGIALAMQGLLEARGARVILTRTSDATLSLAERTDLARRADVDLWVSVHNNAFPDGVDPWSNSGTSVYYNHPSAAGLARSVQRALLEELGLRDLGVGRADLHQARFTWAPAILTESMFMMIPEHEAFLRSEEGRRRVAEAHVRGISAWLRDRAEGR